mgnify:CR=1 FL=1
MPIEMRSTYIGLLTLTHVDDLDGSNEIFDLSDSFKALSKTTNKYVLIPFEDDKSRVHN